MGDKVIYKYAIDESKREQTILLPAGSRIYSIFNQNEEIVIYAIVPFPVEESVQKKITIRLVETEQRIWFDVNCHQFLGTVSTHGGKFVYHVFYYDHGYMG